MDDREETEQADKQVALEFYELTSSIPFVSRNRIVFRLLGETSVYLLLALDVHQHVPCLNRPCILIHRMSRDR